MERVKVPWKGWVLVCDGAKALLFQNDGDAELINLKALDAVIEHEPPTRDLGTDRPGRVYQSHSTARSATEETDWHAKAEEAFLARLAERLDKGVREHAVTSVVLVAPPRALGVLRRHLTPALQGAVTAEVAKDLVRMPTSEIERHLAG